MSICIEFRKCTSFLRRYICTIKLFISFWLAISIFEIHNKEIRLNDTIFIYSILYIPYIDEDIIYKTISQKIRNTVNRSWRYKTLFNYRLYYFLTCKFYDQTIALCMYLTRKAQYLYNSRFNCVATFLQPPTTISEMPM